MFHPISRRISPAIPRGAWAVWWMPVLLSVLIWSPAAGQESETESRAPWRLSYFPYLTAGANDGPYLAGRVRYWQPAPYEDRVTASAALNVDVGITAAGSRYAQAEFRGPQIWRDWRIVALAQASREARFGYFGLGNDSEFDGDLDDETQPFLYRVKRTRYRGLAEVTRRVRGPFLVALRAEYESVDFSALPGPSRFAEDFGAGGLEQDDGSLRLSFVYDTRDVEYNTHQGLLLEAGAQVGSGGGDYSRLYTDLRGYLTVREGTVLAARLLASGMGGDPPLNARFTIPAWEYTYPVLGGEYSHRAFDTGRYSGEHVLLGNFEVRHDLLNLGDFGGLTLLAFLDAGRVFEEESFELTTDDLHVGGGGGLAVRILRSTIFTFNFAGGPDGFNFTVGSRWTF